MTSLALQLFPPSGKVTGTDVLHELGCNAKDGRALTAHRLASLREGLLTLTSEQWARAAVVAHDVLTAGAGSLNDAVTHEHRRLMQ